MQAILVDVLLLEYLTMSIEESKNHVQPRGLKIQSTHWQKLEIEIRLSGRAPDHEQNDRIKG